MKKIAFLSTGGTIAMQSGEDGLADSTLGARKLLEEANFKSDDIEILEIDYKNIASCNMRPENVIEIKELIEEAIAKEDIDGVVITHGTDTLQETAYLLDITLDTDIPVVITGAQRNSSMPSSDVAINIIDSIIVASNDKSKGRGVMVVFAEDIIPARYAIKTHTARVDTFKSPEFGAMGTVSNNRPIFVNQPLIREHYPVGYSFSDKKVIIIPSYQGQDSSSLYHAIDDKVDGIIIEGVGAGHVAGGMIPGIEAAVAAGIEVVLTTRSRFGRLFTNTYGYLGSETQLQEIGVTLGEDLTPEKLRLKLMLLLSNNYSHEQIKETFEKNFYY